jgi:hypothetical protein
MSLEKTIKLAEIRYFILFIPVITAFFCSNPTTPEIKTLLIESDPQISFQININENQYSTPVRYTTKDGEKITLFVKDTVDFDRNTFIIGPDERYIFLSWNDGITANPRNIIVDTNIDLWPRFDLKYKVEIQTNPSLISAITDTGWKEKGCTVTLSATEVSNYSFNHWEINGVAIQKQQEISVVVDEPKNIIAQYERIPSWTNLTMKAPFAPRDGAGALTFAGKMWLLGGWNPYDSVHFPTTTNSEVWSSSDGTNWTLVTSKAPWEERHSAGYVVHNNRMWVVGGDCIQNHYQWDIWSSEDGVNWIKECDSVPWGPRVLHCIVEYNGKIWVMGGQTIPQHASAEQKYYNDVWNSDDGRSWTRITEHAPWSERGMIIGSAILNGRMWIIGGGTYNTPADPERRYYNDVWSTADGISWERHIEHAPWQPRQYHTVVSWEGKLWVIAGCNQQNLGDVWYSVDGVEWMKLHDTPWKPRHAASVYVCDDTLWIMSGSNMQSDVWKLF